MDPEQLQDMKDRLREARSQGFIILGENGRISDEHFNSVYVQSNERKLVSLFVVLLSLIVAIGGAVAYCFG